MVEAPSSVRRIVAARTAGHTRTLARTLGPLADMCWTRAGWTDGGNSRRDAQQPFPATAERDLYAARG